MRVERDTGHFIALAGLIVALFIWSDSRMNGRVDRLEAGLRAEIAELRAEVATLRAEIANFDDRVARLEDAVAALGRLFPGDGQSTQAPDTGAGE